MKINHYQIDPKASPTAQSLVQGEIDALVSFWQDIRDDDLIGPDVAFDLLATWAHLRRFDSNTLDEGLVTRLNTLVSSDLGLVCERTLDFPFPTNWPDEASRLDDEWDYVVDDDQIDKLEHAIREHFELLDRGSLVAYAISTLGSPHCEDERYKLFLKSLLRAENYLADDPSVLLPAAVYASSMLDSYRHDLYDVDEMLWDTTIKHRCLQELIDEQENQNRPTVLPTLHFREKCDGWISRVGPCHEASARSSSKSGLIFACIGSTPNSVLNRSASIFARIERHRSA